MVAALLKLTQGLSTATGQALFGVDGTPVTIANNVNTGVTTWTFTFLDTPPGSSIPIGVYQSGSTPTATFTPDVTGGYLIELTVSDGSSSSTDTRTFGVKRASGRFIPPFESTDTMLNFGGQLRGWAKYMEEWLTEVDSLANNASYFVNVKDFGALGDGSTDDTAAIQAAITSVGGASAAVILFPPGTYLVSGIDTGNISGRRDGLIFLGAGQALTGLIAGGTTLRALGSQAFVLKIASLNVQLHNMCIDGNFQTTTAALRFEYFTNNALIRNVNVTRSLGWNGSTGGDLVGFDYDGNNLEIDNVKFENCLLEQDAANGAHQTRLCVNLVGTNVFEISFANCGFRAGFNLVQLNGGSASFIDNCQFYDHGEGGIRIVGGTQTFRMEDCYSEFASGNFFYAVSLVSDFAPTISIENCEFNANIVFNLPLNQPVILKGNTFKGNINLVQGDEMTYGFQPVFDFGNSFANGATYTGTGLANLRTFSYVNSSVFASSQQHYLVPQLFGAKGDGTTDDSTAFAALITAAVNQDIFIPSGSYRIGVNTTFDNGSRIRFARGASLSIDTSVTVEFDDPIDAFPDQTIFTGLGTVTFGTASQERVLPDWWDATSTSCVQKAVTAASAAKIPVYLLPKQYPLGAGSIGLTVTNPNTTIIGLGSVGDATTAVTGAELYYTGTNIAVQTGNGSTTSFTENLFLQNFAIKTNDNCATALDAWAPADSTYDHLTIFGPSGNTKFCLKIHQSINTVFNKLKVNGTGRAGTATEGNYANGISVLPVSGSPTTTTLISDTYTHGCFVGLTVDTSILRVDGVIFETSFVGYVVQSSSSVEFFACHFENVGFSGAGVGVGEHFHGTTTKLDSCEVIMGAGTTVAFNVQGASGGCTLTLVNNRYTATDPSTLFTASGTTNGNRILLLDYPNFISGTWHISDSTGTLSGQSPDWRHCLVSGMHVVKYTFNLSSLAANVTGAQVFPDNGSSSNSYFMTGNGFVLGMSYSYTSSISAGTLRVHGKINGTTAFDGNASSSQFMTVDHEVDGNPVVQGDALSVTVDSSSSFAPTGGDLIVEFYVGYVR